MSSLAKLTPPRLFDVISRQRLFVVMDSLRAHPVVWVQGISGAGKTALVASYLESRKLRQFGIKWTPVIATLRRYFIF